MTESKSLTVEQLRIVAGVQEVVEQQAESREVLPEDVLDVIVEEFPPEFDEDDVEEVMQLMARAGMLDARDGLGDTIYEPVDVEPSECEWCGSPLPEAGRRDVRVYDEQGRPRETETICAKCLRERF